MPAKKSDVAKSTTHSVYRSARSTCPWATADSTPPFASRRSAVASAADRYSGISNGVRGAFGFVSGFVAIHAETAGRNSGRKRRK